ncbi:MAG: type IV toxin-antitoxin system AbiEi family antitoxin domain-containing protein [Chitinispirillaceae bacterium]|nr:type IV toxin-antitoxin system AbiEi family antitoxin domain-containing protein [Chitinispirillaceae bacterium]
MTGIQWVKLLEKQYREYNKPVYTVTELASLSGSARHSLLVQLSRLVKRGVLVRYKHGLYGIAQYPPEQVIAYLDPSAYCTGHYALYKQGFVTQIPSTVTCFTKKHHCRNRIFSAGPDRYEFFKPASRIYSHPGSGMAPPEQAFCDYVYFCRNRGFKASSVSTFRKLSSLDKQKVEKLLAHYPKTVLKEASQLL